jgi:membrane glycosyltransferase
VELHPAARLIPDAAGDTARRYLDRIALGPAEREAALEAAARAPHGAAPALRAIHEALAGGPVDPDFPTLGSLRRRLDAALHERERQPDDGAELDLHGRVRLVSTPPFNRTPMAPHRWLSRFTRRRDGAEPRSTDPRGHWQPQGVFRRLVLLVLIIAQTYVAAHFMVEVLPYNGRQPLELAILALFVILFGWISAGFWTAMAGFVVQAIGRDSFAISRTASTGALDAKARVAVVMPICNEDVVRVYAGLRATCESIAARPEAAHFDFYVLSDTGNPEVRVAETAAWLQLRRVLGDSMRLYYRWRQHRIKRKSGNIADFCRRWGADYRYMVILDADSVMSGACLAQLLRIMEANPNAGIVQTAPHAAGRETLHARIQQFAAGAYGPLFTAGLHFWQLGEAHYWGHNAIIRVAPFMRHCALGRLPGDGSLSGEILSHDFVEAALMRRAGWAVWIAYDLPGSYEEMPPNLIDELTRDRRWCQGNLMNFRLLALKGLHPAHRAVFAIGAMAYVSAPLWFLSLVLGTALLAVHTLTVPTYFTQPHQLFPLWPEWHPDWALALFSTTALMLFLPKFLSALTFALRGKAREFGGAMGLLASILAEMLVSMLLAPIRMLFHTQFVITALMGWRVRWKSPPRADAETGWLQAIQRHGLHTLIGVAWAGFVYWLDPKFLYWMLPVAGALILSIPISVFTSRVSPGRRARARGLFLIPEELAPPEEIRRTQEHLANAPALPDFAHAVVDPIDNAVAVAGRITDPARFKRAAAEGLALADRALVEGPAVLSAAEKSRLLGDPRALSQLHFDAWTSPRAHAGWREVLRHLDSKAA